jgi:hypothetical protein
MSALIRYYFKENPYEMGDDEFYQAWGDLMYSLRWSQVIKIQEGESPEEPDDDDVRLEDIKLASNVNKGTHLMQTKEPKIIAHGKKTKI